MSDSEDDDRPILGRSKRERTSVKSYKIDSDDDQEADEEEDEPLGKQVKSAKKGKAKKVKPESDDDGFSFLSLCARCH